MRVSASLAFWYFMFFIAVWKQFLKIEWVQWQIHKLKVWWLPPLLQWYTMYIVGIIFWMCYSVIELLAYLNIGTSTATGNLEDAYDFNRDKFGQIRSRAHPHGDSNSTFETFEEPFKIPHWLLFVNIGSLFAGFPVCIIASYQAVKVCVLPAKSMAKQDSIWKHYIWAPPERLNWMLFIIAMPIMYSVSAMRAMCRIWALATGTADGTKSTQWENVESYEFALYHQDLELGSVVQFTSVFAFARLCGFVLKEWHHRQLQKNDDKVYREQAEEMSSILSYVVFLGVWAFIVVGVTRCLVAFGLAELVHHDLLMGETSEFQHKLLAKVSTVFAALTVVCVINMLIICSMQSVRDRLGNANLKFAGTRALLLVGELQSRVLDFFTIGAPVLSQMKKIPYLSEISHLATQNWTFSPVQARLLHLSLLNIESLCVVLFNLHVWHHFEIAFFLRPGDMELRSGTTLHSQDEGSWVLAERFGPDGCNGAGDDCCTDQLLLNTGDVRDVLTVPFAQGAGFKRPPLAACRKQ